MQSFTRSRNPMLMLGLIHIFFVQEFREGEVDGFKLSV